MDLPPPVTSELPDGALLGLDEERCLDPTLAGAKAAWLARGRQAGLPVLPGVVIPATESMKAMAHGVEVMGVRGSGGARLAMSQEPLSIPLSEAVIHATGGLSEPMVVRSSSILEGSGEWSGAFTSYLEIFHGEVETAIRGCWASAFTVNALERYEAARITPGSAAMAVLIQPALKPDFGGTARLSGQDTLVVGVAGSPAPLVQGWEPGAHARVAASGAVSGQPAIDLMGVDLLSRVAELLRRSHELVGSNSMEWASVGTELWVLQLLRTADTETNVIEIPAALASPTAGRIARAVRRAPGPLGEALVLPWAIADPERYLEPVEPIDIDPVEALREAVEQARSITAEVWGVAKPVAAARAGDALRGLRSSDPGAALSSIEQLRPPDPERATLVLGMIAQIRRTLVAAGAVSRPELAWHLELDEVRRVLAAGRAEKLRDRIGFDRWEPFDVAVIMSHGAWSEGVSAAPGIAGGRLCFVSDPYDVPHFRPRDVVVGTHPLPNLAALLWDASALITTGGGPGAHLFESARALGIPAVCAVHLDEALGSDLHAANERVAVGVDGNSGRVAVTAW